MRWRSAPICWLIAGLLLLTACSGRPVAQVTPQQYLVKRGDTLSSIAWRFQLDFRTLAQWNRLRQPYTIYPGQRLFVTPPPGYRVADSRQSPAERTRPGTRPGTLSRPPVSVPAPPPEPALVWQWPTHGTVGRRFSGNGNGGIDIRGVEGQAVLAAAPGTVVYSGAGLKGYGQLIIVRHSQTYLSAYAHNRRRLVKEGDVVKKGQAIAELGKNNKGDSILHFEIRKFGKPVDPMVFLPRLR